MMIVNDDSRVINKFETSLTENAGGIIYDRHMFIVQATCFNSSWYLFVSLLNNPDQKISQKRREENILQIVVFKNIFI
jgi:hypothetical protein